MNNAEINRRNREFWKEQTALMEKRMGDSTLRDIALDILADEDLRQIPGYFRISIEKALEDAEKIKKRFVTQRAQKGGKAKKDDPLQKIICIMVEEEQEISWKGLLKRLKDPRFHEVIERVDETFIYFRNKKGKIKTAAITGLKDQLRRARDKINSQKPVSANSHTSSLP